MHLPLPHASPQSFPLLHPFFLLLFFFVLIFFTTLQVFHIFQPVMSFSPSSIPPLFGLCPVFRYNSHPSTYIFFHPPLISSAPLFHLHFSLTILKNVFFTSSTFNPSLHLLSLPNASLTPSAPHLPSSDTLLSSLASITAVFSSTF